MQATEWFKLWFSSPYYEILYHERNKAEAAAFVDRLATGLNLKQNSLALDAACGRGRYSIALAEKGLNVTGIDISATTITEAKKHENEHLQFFLHDMRLPFYINYFDYAFNFFTSFGYFRTLREHNDAMRTIAQSLKPHGLFVIDYMNVHFAETNLVASETKTINNVVFDIERWQDENHFYKRIQVKDAEKNVEESFTEQVEKFSLGDFTDMLSYQGMQVDHVFGDYALNNYDIKHSPRMIITATKINA